MVMPLRQGKPFHRLCITSQEMLVLRVLLSNPLASLCMLLNLGNRPFV